MVLLQRLSSLPLSSPFSLPLPLCQQKHLFAAEWTYASQMDCEPIS